MVAHRIGILYSIFIFGLVAQLSIFAEAKEKSKKKSDDSALSDLKYKAGDEVGNDVRALKTEVFIAKTETQAIQQAEKLLKKYKGTTLEPDLLFRLAELYIRRAKTDRFLELHRQSETLVNLIPKQVKNSSAKSNILKGIDYYEIIQKKWTNYNRLDEVLFNNAFAHQQIDREDRAEKLFNHMIKEFPDSLLVPDAHLALGEMNFRRKEFDVALKHFVAIRSYPDSLVYPYGIYKAAWTKYNLRDTKGGLAELEDVVAFGHTVQERGVDSRLDLRKEALADMALFFEDVYPAKDAFKYFEKHAKTLDVAPFILKLSSLYKRHSRHQDVRTTLSEFIERRPTSEAVPNAYLEMLDASDKLKKYKDVIALLENYQSLCQPDSKWSKNQNPNALQNKDSSLFELVDDSAGPQNPQEVCMSSFRKNALSYANRWLKIWKKSNKETEVADVTEKAFEVYLREDPKNEESGKARFVYAELLFQRNKFRPASVNYAIASEFVKEPSLVHDAHYYAIIALEKAVQDKWSDKDEATFTTYAKAYLKANPTAKFATDVEFKMGFIAYEKGRYDDAAPIFKKLADSNANTERVIKSQDLYLDILNIKKQYEPLRDYAFSLKSKTKDQARTDKLTKIYEEAYFLIIQSLESKEEYVKAVDLYNKFADTNPNSALTQKALWNAMQLRYKSGDLLGGARASLAFSNKFPKDKQSIDALTKAAQTLESMAQLDEAAEILVRLSQVDTLNASKWSKLAADFYLLSGNLQKAKPFYEKQSIAGDRRSLAQLEKIALLEGNTTQYESILRRMISLGHQPEASVAEAYFLNRLYEAKKYSEAFQSAKKIISLSKSGASSKALAQARLVQARVLAMEYKSQSVKSQLDRVSTVLQLKTEKLSKAQEAYQSTIKYEDPETSLIAMSELSDIYIDYAETMRKMPLPAGVDEKEEAPFRAEMDKLAIPMEERGIETKVAALKQAKVMGIKNPMVDELQKSILKFNQTAPVENLVRAENAEVLYLTYSDSYTYQSARGFTKPTLDCPSSDKSWRKESVEILVSRANACYFNKKWSRLDSIANFLATTEPNSIWGTYYLSLSALAQSQYEKSLWMADLSIKKSPKLGLVHYQKGLVLWAMKEGALSLASIKESIKFDSKNADAHLFMAQVLHRDGDSKSAESYYKSLIELEPSSLTALVGLADIKYERKDWKGAINHLSLAVDAAPSRIELKVRLAELYETQKEYSLALHQYRRINEMTKSNKIQNMPFDLNEKIKYLEPMVTKEKSKNEISQRLEE